MIVATRRPWKLGAAALGLGMILVACADAPEPVEQKGSAISKIEGRWMPTEAVAPNGVGTTDEADGDCAGDMTAGAKQLRQQLLQQFTKVKEIGGYNCRANTANTSQLSIHAMGRALDIMTGDGTDIADYLVQNSNALGIQRIIWNHTIWQRTRSGATSKQYSGPNPHTDHVHAEIDKATAQNGPGQGGPVTPTDPSGVGNPNDPSVATGAPSTGFPTDQTGTGFPSGTTGFPSGTTGFPSGTTGFPSGTTGNGFSAPVDSGQEFECATARDCDPSGTLQCIQGFCQIDCNAQNRQFGICEGPW
jgi:hypothetical protein